MKLTSFMLIIVVGAAGLYAYDRIKAERQARAAEPAALAARPAIAAPQVDPPWGHAAQAARPVERQSAYRCDGRQHCSQMRSCEEAKYFIQNCPNTRMDGDRDGIPCEDQWCR